MPEDDRGDRCPRAGDGVSDDLDPAILRGVLRQQEERIATLIQQATILRIERDAARAVSHPIMQMQADIEEIKQMLAKLQAV